MNVKEFFTPEQMEHVKASIHKAEKDNTGEIRLHVEGDCEGDVIERAVKVFHRLHMHKTNHRNAVLFYLAVNHKKLAVVGDEGIHKKVSEEFWHTVKDHIIAKFKQNNYAEGLCEGIEMTGEMLRRYFPNKGEANTNQLPDDISFGK
jgi:uncharacterized membrane protein